MEDALPALSLAYGLSRLAFRLRSFCKAPLSTAAAEVAIRQRLEDQVQRMVSTLIEARRPDVIFLGRETYAACVASISIRRQLPFVQRLPGATTHGILDGQYPPELGAAMLETRRHPRPRGRDGGPSDTGQISESGARSAESGASGARVGVHGFQPRYAHGPVSPGIARRRGVTCRCSTP